MALARGMAPLPRAVAGREDADSEKSASRGRGMSEASFIRCRWCARIAERTEPYPTRPQQSCPQASCRQKQAAYEAELAAAAAELQGAA